MNSTERQSAIATATTSSKPKVHTPQRKARLYDKQRVRLKDVKGWALKRCGCSSSTEVKKYLKQLGTVLDLRMTSAWIAINSELAIAIKQLREVDTCTARELFKSGDRVIWDYPTGWGYIEKWFPLVVTKVIGNKAYLDMLENPVPVSQLQLVA